MSLGRIFVRNRALGCVSDNVPLVIRYIATRKEYLVVTCVGKEFHTYNCSHFTLLSVSGTHPDNINCLSADRFYTFTASKNVVYAWRRGTDLNHTYNGHDAPVHNILPFGPNLVTVDEDSTVKVWDIKSEVLISEINFSNIVFKITTLIHPNTYMNKILFGSEQGQLQLWNLKVTKCIYTFKGWNSAVTALEQAPAIDVVAIGLTDGRIIIHNLKLDETVFELVQDWGAVTSITFRSDGHPIMATGSSDGHILFWNLEQRKIESQLHKAHNATVTGLKYLPNEPLMVSSSPDNSLKLWIFDLADGAGRLLRIREGHGEPPTLVRFYGNHSRNILSAGGDSSLRIFSTVTETFNKSLGRASFNRKASKKKKRTVEDPLLMPPIVDIAAETIREKDWNNIIACHSGLGMVTTWSYDQSKMGDLKLLPEKFKSNLNVIATSLCLTRCGNFAVIGYNTGHVERFNVQSGIHRASYGSSAGAHNGPVKGIMVDPLNQTVITAGRDMSIKFWHFNQKTGVTNPSSQLTIPDSVEWLRYHPESSLIAVALEDFSIIIIDLDTKRIVRHFEGHEGRLTDGAFSPDSRWIITASMDCTVRTWDIPSSHLIDVFEVSDACISLHFSPTGDFLVTAHVCNLGIYLWSNKSLYSHISLKAIKDNEEVPLIRLPGSAVENNDDVDYNTLMEDLEEYVSPEQLDKDLITMSALANSRWQNLLNIDVVKKRNKPREAPKSAEAAPFFLPTIPSLSIQFDFSNLKHTEDSQILHTQSDIQNLSLFGKLLQSTTASNDYSSIVEQLKTMGPSAVDFEIQSLALDLRWSEILIFQFMKMLNYMMQHRKDFELSQAYLAVFLKYHGKIIAETKVLRDYLVEVQNAQQKNWFMLRDKFFYILSVVHTLKKM